MRYPPRTSHVTTPGAQWNRLTRGTLIPKRWIPTHAGRAAGLEARCDSGRNAGMSWRERRALGHRRIGDESLHFGEPSPARRLHSSPSRLDARGAGRADLGGEPFRRRGADQLHPARGVDVPRRARAGCLVVTTDAPPPLPDRVEHALEDGVRVLRLVNEGRAKRPDGAAGSGRASSINMTGMSSTMA